MHARDTQSARRVAGLVTAMLIGASRPAGAQSAKAVPILQAPPRVAMIGTTSMGTMSDEPANPHQALAMAYRDNMIAFATLMRTQATEGKSVDVDIARAAMTEMRRSFDKMKEHHEAFALAADDATKARMAAMEHPMATHLASLGEHLTALEDVVNSTTPNAAGVIAHSSAILKECEGMSAMHDMKKNGMAMPSKPKSKAMPMSMPAKSSTPPRN